MKEEIKDILWAILFGLLTIFLWQVSEASVVGFLSFVLLLWKSEWNRTQK